MKDLLERKLKQLNEGLRKMEADLASQRGGIRVVELLLEEIAEREAAAALDAQPEADPAAA